MGKKNAGDEEGVLMGEIRDDMIAEMMSVLRGAKDAGTIEELASALSFWNKQLSQVAGLTKELESMWAFVEKGRHVELVFGRGAMLDLKHPWVSDYLETGHYDGKMAHAAEAFQIAMALAAPQRRLRRPHRVSAAR